MPVRTVKVKGGYKAKDKKGKTYSKKPMSKAKAKAQVTAINISEGHAPGLKPRKSKKH